MREHLDLHGHPDGLVVTYRGKPVCVPMTWTGAIRVMASATEALKALEQDATPYLLEHLKEVA